MRTTTRQLLQGLQALKVQNLDRAPLLSDEVQLVYSLGDYGDLFPPIEKPEGWSSRSIAAIVGEATGQRVAPPPDSAIAIIYAANEDAGGAGNAMRFGVQPIDYGWNQAGTDTPDWSTGGTTRAALDYGGMTGSVAGLTSLQAGETLPDAALPIFVWPGDAFWFVGGAQNQASSGTIGWREIPVPPAGK